jgi:hypothetical protein
LKTAVQWAESFLRKYLKMELGAEEMGQVNDLIRFHSSQLHGAKLEEIEGRIKNLEVDAGMTKMRGRSR